MDNLEYQNLTDEALLSLWRDGKIEAYDVLFKRYYSPLLKYANSNIKDQMAAEEIVMDVMVRIWHKNGQIDSPAGFKAYILRAVKNAIFNYFRSTIPISISIDNVGPDAHLKLAAPDADARLRQKEIHKKYQTAMASLSEKKKEVFTMSREGNLSYKEIAEVLNISVNTVENYMAASLSHLRKKLNS